jgi:uncharacterized protein YkwD
MKTWAVRLILAVVTTAILPVLDMAPANAADPTASSVEVRFVDLLNSERVARGLPRLTRSLTLDAVARSWSATMAGGTGLAHRSDLANQVTATERGWRRAGENVGYGGGVEALHRAFMDSPAHLDNVVGDWTKLGVGVVVADGTIWVTFNFVKSAPPVVRKARKVTRTTR